MSASLLTIGKLALSLTALAKDSPLNKLAKNEYYMALYILKSANDSQSVREVINNALGHLESAFVNFPITTWVFWNRDRALWKKKTFANDICLHIAILHYMLGNMIIAKQWLLENLNVMGSINFPSQILKTLSMNNEYDFYKAIAGREYSKIEDLIQQSSYNWDMIFDYDDDPGPCLRGGCYSGG